MIFGFSTEVAAVRQKRGIRRGCALAAALSILVCVPRALPALTGDEVVERVQQTYDSLKAISFSFVEKEVGENGATSVVSRGKLSAMLPRKFKVEYSVPKGKVFASDGEDILVEVPGSDPVRISVGGVPESSPGLFFLEFLKNMEFRVAGEEKVGKFACIKLNARAAGEDPSSAGIRLWVDKRLWVVVQAETEDDGVVRRFVLGDIVLNPTLSPGIFTLPR